jgi:glycosyltransferase involved in cell wall biosynthesis
LKIALATRSYWPAVGGIEQVAVELGRALRGLGHEVSVIAQRTDAGRHGSLTHAIREAPAFAPFTHDGVPVRQFRLPVGRRLLLLPLAHEGVPIVARAAPRHTRRLTRRLYSLAAARELEALLVGSDVVHVLGGAWISVAAVAAARTQGIPVVVTPFVHVGYWRDDAASVWSYLNADRVLATTRADAADLALLGVPAEQIDVAGLPVAGIGGDGQAQPQAPPLVVFVGTRAPHKGVDLLRRAARHVWAEHPETRFAFLGGGAALREPDERELDVGLVSDEERAQWIRRALLLALPSSSESFGLVVAEAWSASRAVVTSDIPVLKELVERSRGGVAVAREPRALAEAIARLVGDRELAAGMGRRGFEFWRSECAPEAVARRHLEIYEAARRVRAERLTPPPILGR